MRSILLMFVVLLCTAMYSGKTALTTGYVGSETCISCHSGMNPDLVTAYEHSGHPYKLNKVDGAPPAFPEKTTPGVLQTPPNTSWSDFAYMIGGYGWKARFVKKDGRVYTHGDSVQFNLATNGWVAYSKGKEVKYDYACFQCHTTGASPEGSWNGVEADKLGTFSEPGIRCEACHGPGAEHIRRPASNQMPISGDALRIERCGDCHQRGGKTSAIPTKDGWVEHHEQINELRASKHGDGKGGELTCASCHDAHTPLQYGESLGHGNSGITTDCQSCHANREVKINGKAKEIACTDCHMSLTGKSAVGVKMGGSGWRGDIRSHLTAINTNPVTRDAMFTADGKFIALDANGLGAVTLDFACLGCHGDKDVQWAASYAENIHVNQINVDTEAQPEVPAALALDQNYPNPFNPTTTIAFTLPEATSVTLSIYTLTGQLVETLVDNRLPAGTHTVELNADFLASGVYLYQLRAGDQVRVKQMVLMK